MSRRSSGTYNGVYDDGTTVNDVTASAAASGGLLPDAVHGR